MGMEFFNGTVLTFVSTLAWPVPQYSLRRAQKKCALELWDSCSRRSLRKRKRLETQALKWYNYSISCYSPFPGA